MNNMKAILKVTILLNLLLILSFELFSQTTQEEYNYITKGYKVQIESGLDMKKGYSFVDLGKWSLSHSSEKRECEFKGLVRQGKTKPCAVMMIYRRTDISDGVVMYICIPSNDSPVEIWNQTLNFINENCKNNDKLQNTMIWALMHFSSSIL
jgi:hypothetical protein